MKIFSRLSLVVVGILLLTGSAFGQYTTTSYFMNGSTQSNMLNPSFAPERGYVQLPVIGGTSVSFGSNSLSMERLFYANPNGEGLVSFLDVDIDKSFLLSAVNNNNNINTDVVTTLLGFGFYSGDVFWTFGSNLRVSSDMNIPSGAFDLVALNQDSGVYTLDHFGINATAYIENYVGATFKIGSKVTVGAKVKLLLGLADMTAYYDDAEVVINGSEWRVTTDGYVNATAAGIAIKDNSLGLSFDNLTYDPEFQISGFGLGVDLGASYDPIDDLTISLSLLDLGFINWSAAHTLSGVSSGSYSYTGAIFSDEGNYTGDVSDIDDILSIDQVEAESRTASLRSTLNVGAEYRFAEDRMAAALLYTVKSRYGFTKHETTAAISIRPTSWFTANASYAFVAGQMGAAINLHPSWINLFVGADYIPFTVTPQYLPLESSNINFYAGIAIPLSKRK